MFGIILAQGRQAPEKPATHKQPAARHKQPAAHQKQPADKKTPAHRQKPVAHKPAAHRPTKPATHGKKTAGRGDLDLETFEDIEFAPLATSGHIH